MPVPDPASTTSPSAQSTLVVPPATPMVSLLGSSDELLGVYEDIVDSDVHVRGNEITFTGPRRPTTPSRMRFFDELLDPARHAATR